MNNTRPAPLWVNNTVGIGSGFGAGVASEPSYMVLEVSPVRSYVSNGSVTIPLTVYVMDQTGSNVTSGTSCTDGMPIDRFDLKSVFGMPMFDCEPDFLPLHQSSSPV